MAQMQTIEKRKLKPSRVHDYLYDKSFAVSSEQDHARHMYKANTNVLRVRKMPKFAQMFSTLRNYPSHTFQLETVDPVPASVDKQWQGKANQQREALVRHNKFGNRPQVHIPEVEHPVAYQRGTNRFLYFKRPIIPFLQQVQPDVILQQPMLDPLAAAEGYMNRPSTPLTRTIQLQTDYRESEAQTDPYSPEYVVRPGSAPEVLALATLSYKRGLPAGLAEVEMIERARAKREWEKTLPASNDMEQLKKRKRMMDNMETKEWAFREHEIEELQAIRLELLEKLLCERELKQQEINEKRYDKLWNVKQKEFEKNAKRIRCDHIKHLRKLLKVREREFDYKRTNKRSVVEECGDFSSQTHAPITRMGVFLDRRSEQFAVNSKYIDSYEGLLELEQSLPTSVLQSKIKAPQKVSKEELYKKKSNRLQRQLDEVYDEIQAKKDAAAKGPKSLRFLVEVKKEKPRPPTPSIATPSKMGEEMEIAAITLQKVIRGRAVQNTMYEGKENRKELIEEIKTTHALQKMEQLVKKEEKQEVVALQRQRKLYQNKQAFVDEALSRLEGEPVGDLLDYLSKELVRLQEERKIHAFCMLAERRRRLKEAAEAGRRQTEERRRREEDEIFKQVVKIHQQTVDTYLEDIVMESVQSTADEQARCEVQKYADKINDIAHRVEHKKTKLESEEICAELVHSFLLPEILKIEARKKIKDEQRKHLMAARSIIGGTMGPVVKATSPRAIYGPDAREKMCEKIKQQEGIASDTKELSEAEKSKIIGYLQNQEDVERHLRAQRQREEELEAQRRKKEEERAAMERRKVEKDKRMKRQEERTMKRDEFGSECSLSEWSSEYDSVSEEEVEAENLADAEEHYKKEVPVEPTAEVATKEEEVMVNLDELEESEDKEEYKNAAMMETVVHDEHATREDDDNN